MTGIIRGVRVALGWRRSGSIGVPAASSGTATTPATNTATLLLLLLEDA